MPVTEDTTAEAKKEKKPHQPRDAAREVIETIVFVVVLVLLLKLFVTEAFVIPTGSMAETLYGYQKLIVCPKCNHEFPVNSHDEVEGRQGDRKRVPVFGYCCPNCRYLGQMREFSEKELPKNNTGDRVLVLKPLFHVRDPERGDVVVFKFPEKPQENFEAANYIKRAMGFGGETVATWRGELLVTKSLDYSAKEIDPETGQPLYPEPENKLDLWQPRFMYSNASRHGNKNPKGLKLFETSRAAGFPPGPNGFGTLGFEIVRKGEKQLLADRRNVWDNDKQPDELAGKVPSRWHIPAESKDGWKADNGDKPKSFSHTGGGEHWVRYRHLSMPWKTLPADKIDGTLPTSFEDLAKQRPTFIDNYLGYNGGREQDPQTGFITSRDGGTEKLWVGDLILECEAELGGDGEVALELSRGVNRSRATFSNGTVTLSRTGPGAETFGTPSRPCKVAAGKYKLRFANVDCKLWVWVNDKLIDFGSEGDYLPPTPEQENNFTDAAPDDAGRTVPRQGTQEEGWTYKNDVDAPASIGAKGQVTVRAITLNRDIYYTRSSSDVADLFYVQPGHYLCLGDNSAQSSDSRTWGTVPERLMLGKAVFVFFPVGRVGFIK
jgi:signal peptidase I